MSIEPAVNHQTRDAVLALVRNWISEWARLFQRMKAVIDRDRQPDILLECSPTEIRVTRNRAGIAPKSLARNEHTATELAALLASENTGTPAIVLKLSDSDILHRSLALPFMASSAVRGAVPFELERLSPLPPEQLYFDYRVVARDKAANRTEVSLRLIKRVVVDDAIALCHRARVQVGAIRLADTDADWRQFPLDRPALLRHLWQGWGLAMLGGLAILLAIAILVFSYARGADANAALADEIDGERLHLAQVEHIHVQIRDAETEIAFPLAQKQRPPLVMILAEITRILPDGTSLRLLSVQQNKAHVQGTSKSASDLIGLLDRSSLFGNAVFTAPIMRDSQDNLDRFDLDVTLKGTSP